MSTKPIADIQDGPMERKRTRIVRPYPIRTLEDALSVAIAVQNTNAGLPFDRVLLAGALGTTPASSGFTMKLNSSAKYGLTIGGYNDALISLTDMGMAIVAPRGDEELIQTLGEVANQPDVFSRFYQMLDGKRLPEDEYAQNMLQREAGIHPDLASECLGIIKANGIYAGILREESGFLYIRLQDYQESIPEPGNEGQGITSDTSIAERNAQATPHDVRAVSPSRGKIFTGHSGNLNAMRFVKELLDDFGISYGSVEEDGDDTQPVPAQVSNEMRGCTSAILVLANGGADSGEGDNKAAERMLYQLGAASVLYGNRIVILVEAGFEAAQNAPDMHRVVFDSERPTEAGLALLRELHRAGVISVTA